MKKRTSRKAKRTSRRPRKSTSRRRLASNPARFRIYDTGGTGDRYTIVDSRAQGEPGRKYYLYFGMNAYPFSPQGIGMHGEFSQSDWSSHVRDRFRSLGKRIKLGDLPPEAARAAEKFMEEPKKNGRRSRSNVGGKLGRSLPAGVAGGAKVSLRPYSRGGGYQLAIDGKPAGTVKRTGEQSGWGWVAEGDVGGRFSGRTAKEAALTLGTFLVEYHEY